MANPTDHPFLPATFPTWGQVLNAPVLAFPAQDHDNVFSTAKVDSSTVIQPYQIVTNVGAIWSNAVDTFIRVAWPAIVGVLTGTVGTGESNTASNVGGGVHGLFKQKTLVDLEFKMFAQGVGITLTEPGDDIILISGSYSIVSVGGGESVFRDQVGGTFNLRSIVAGANITITPAADTLTISTGGAAGEINTASNIGVDGVGVFDQKLALDLQFRNIAPASTKLTVVLNGTDIDLDVNVAVIDHDSLDNTGVNTHADLDSHVSDVLGHSGVLDLPGARAMTGNLNVDGNDIVGGIQLGGSLTEIGVFEYLDEIGSVGFFGDPAGLLSPNATTFDVAAGVGSFHTTASPTSVRGIGDWVAALVQPIPLDSVRYVGVEWNTGTPQVVVKTANTWDLVQEWPIGIVTRDLDGVHTTPVPPRLSDSAMLVNRRIAETEPFARSSGLNLATNLLTLQRSAGRGWLVTTPIDYDAFDSNAADTFERYYQDTPSGWIPELTRTSFEDQSFENESGTLGVITNGRYGVRWVYMDLANGNLSVVYGTSNVKTAAEAGLENQPTSLPDRLQVGHILLGRVIFLKSAGVANTVEDVWSSDFLSGVGDGDVVGPDGGVVMGEIAVYADTTGKALEVTGVGIADVELVANKGAVSGYASLDTNVAVIEPAQKIRTTTGPTVLTVGAVADGDFLKRVGSTIVGDPGGGGGATTLAMGFQTRTTTVSGIGTSPSFIAYDTVDSDVGAGFFTYSGGTFTAQSTFSAFVYTEASMQWVSGTEPEARVDIVINAGPAIGQARANCYSSLLQKNHLSCVGFSNFVAGNTLRVYWYTDIGGISLIAFTPKIVIIPTSLV